VKALRVTEEHTLKRVRNLRLWLKDLQSEDEHADRHDDNDPHNLGLSDLHAIELEFRSIAERLYKTEAALESLREFIRGEHSITLDFAEAAEFFRMNRTQDSETYTVRLSDLYRLAADKRGRDEQDAEDAR